MGTTLTFLGIASAVPDAGEDTASFLVNGELLFDCGWANVLQMTALGYDPLRVQTLFFTHCHHDHYLGLPAFLFYRAMKSASPAPLTIVGPADDLSLVVERAMSFLQAERFAPLGQELQIVTLEPGETWQNERYEIQTIRALHPVSGFCGRLLDQRSGVAIAFSGDTAFHPALSQLARGADLLIHEASVPPQQNKSSDHSSAADAARIAREADVQALRLIHAVAAYRDASLREAQSIFPRTELAAMGETLTWPAP